MKTEIWLSRLAYKRTSRILEELRLESRKYRLIDVVNHIDLRAIIVDNIETNVRYIVFRGTSNIRNWLRNTDSRSQRFQDGYIRKGFYDAVMSIKPHIESYTQTDREVVACGHSLGGIMGFIFKNVMGSRVRIAKGIGTPRGYKGSLNSINNKEYLRLEHDLDPVPWLPLTFEHIGECLYINRRKKLVRNPTGAYKRIDSLIEYAFRRLSFQGWIVEDHSLDEYCKYYNINHRRGK